MALITKADANPTKAFFVRMITRDITLEDCILDLVDNSIDGAWQMQGGVPMALNDDQSLAEFTIDIVASEDKFQISDNCGGIDLDAAANYAFTFGRKDDTETESYSIGVYGIGMKRAVFKMGTAIEIVSTYVENDEINSFEVPIDVEAWLANDERDWDFDLNSADNLPSPGVKITVSNLNEQTAASFASPAFLQDLRRVISRDYALHLARGLIIKLNGEQVVGWKIELLQGGEFSAMRKEYLEELEDGSVRIELIAGMAAVPPESSDPDGNERKEERNGWYVVCNGRIVVAADRTTLTGWGTDGWPQWHPQYSGFIGLILFTSEKAKLLPLTTTKRSVDSSSAVYRRAKPLMRDVSKQWIAYTNERKQALVDAKAAEATTKPVAIRDVGMREIVSLPRLVAKPAVTMANIAYAMPKDRVRALASSYGDINMAFREVGIRSFDYAYSEQVGEE